MPFFLKLIFFHGFFFLIGAFLSLLPIPGLFHIDDKNVSYKEWWLSGVGIEFFIISLSIGIGAVCLLKKTKKARTIYLLALSFVFVVFAVFDSNRTAIAQIVISWAFVFVLFYWYFFCAKSVQKYFINDL